MSADGSELLWSTYWGGSGNENSHSLTIDSANNIIITGDTNSEDFPTDQHTFGSSSGTRGFISRFTSEGALMDSTTIGGSSTDEFYKLGVDHAGNFIALGNTQSQDLPMVPECFMCDREKNEIGNTDLMIYKFASLSTSNPTSTGIGGDVIVVGFSVIMLYGIMRKRK